MNEWRPMSEHVFPWRHEIIDVVAYRKDDACKEIMGMRCRVGEHGALFECGGGLLSIHEEGFVPYAWRAADAPEPDDEKWPPLLEDYLTRVDAA